MPTEIIIIIIRYLYLYFYKSYKIWHNNKNMNNKIINLN
jgi:hypothetical protein